MTMLFAGHETTVTAIDAGAVLLATHPDQRADLLRDRGHVRLEVVVRHERINRRNVGHQGVRLALIP